MKLGKVRTKQRKMMLIYVCIIYIMMLGVFGKLVYIMVVKGEYYSQKALDVQERERRIKAARGKILDRNELLGYYGISDLLLFPSTFDTNGLVVREAAACATPSLLVRGSCAAEGVEDGKTGFLCVESAHSIRNTLNTIMENKELLKTVGKNAQSQIYISWEDAIKKAYERYYTVIDNFKTKNNL